MHIQVSESYEFVSHFISLRSRGGGGKIFYQRGRYFPRKSTLGGELVLRIFSPPEKISGGRFCPVTPRTFYAALVHGTFLEIVFTLIRSGSESGIQTSYDLFLFFSFFPVISPSLKQWNSVRT